MGTDLEESQCTDEVRGVEREAVIHSCGNDEEVLRLDGDADPPRVAFLCGVVDRRRSANALLGIRLLGQGGRSVPKRERTANVKVAPPVLDVADLLILVEVLAARISHVSLRVLQCSGKSRAHRKKPLIFSS